MAQTYTKKNIAMIVIGVLSLVGLLSYTWVHTSNLLASYVNPPIVGFLAAAGIELSIVGLSMRIGELKRSGLSTRFFVFTLVAVVVVSALANIAEGFSVRFAEPLTIANVGKLDIVQAIVSTTATGLISLVTLALSEIVGQDVNTVAKAMKRQERIDNYQELDDVPQLAPQDTIVSLTPPVNGVSQVMLPAPKSTGVILGGYGAFKESMSSMNGSAPKTISQVEKEFGLSHATAARYLSKYKAEQKA